MRAVIAALFFSICCFNLLFSSSIVSNSATIACCSFIEGRGIITSFTNAEFRLFEPLMLDVTEENKDLDFMERLNPNSLTVLNGFVEEELKSTVSGTHYQFVRNGYYVTDKDSTNEKLVFNRTCGLKSSFKL